MEAELYLWHGMNILSDLVAPLEQTCQERWECRIDAFLHSVLTNYFKTKGITLPIIY